MSSIATHDFLICYDISDRKRVSHIARVVEKQAMRIQMSIYYYEGVTQSELMHLVEQIVSLMDEEADDLRIYRIRDRGISMGDAIDLDHPLLLN